MQTIERATKRSSCKPSGFSSCLSSNDAITLLEFIHRSLSCNEEMDFVNLFAGLQELVSFDFATTMLGHWKNNEIVMVHDVNISFPEEWLHEYMSKNYLQVDSVIRDNFTTYEVQHWSLGKKRLHRRKDITSLCMDFGMRECYTHGIRPQAPGNNSSMFCFSGSSIIKSKRTTNILEFVIPHLHLALSQVFSKKNLAIKNVILSVREKEVLEWLKHGKSSWDISVILGISKRTVDFHVYNILQKLEATNRPQAVAIAIRLGLIDLG